MILTTPIKQPYTTTQHNNNGYIFTLYLCMLLCVVGNCLLFYCSCTGNCENSCGINGNESVSGGIKNKNESEIKKNNNNSEIKYKQNNENNNIKDNKEENKEEKKEEKKIEDEEHKIEEVEISDEGKIDYIKIVNAEFVKAKLVKTYVYKGSSDNDEIWKKEFMDKIKPTGETYLSAYVEVKKFDDSVVGYFIHCKNANSKIEANVTCGLFNGSEATKIEILRCGSEIEDMNSMFYDCMSLTKIIFSNKFNTNNVKDMRYMFYYCSSLKKLNLSNFNTNKVTDMFGMFDNCSSLTELDLSNFNTNNVTYMSWMFDNCSSLTVLNLDKFNTVKVTDIGGMFYNCFKEKHTSTLICKASTIQKIANNRGSYLTITNEKKAEINDNNNQGKVYKCSVKRGGNNPEITEVEEYQPHQ